MLLVFLAPFKVQFQLFFIKGLDFIMYDVYISDDPNLKHAKKEKYSQARRLMNLLDEVIFMSNDIFIFKKRVRKEH